MCIDNLLYIYIYIYILQFVSLILFVDVYVECKQPLNCTFELLYINTSRLQ